MHHQHLARLGNFALGLMLAGAVSGPALANDTIPLTGVPLFITTGAEPNLLITYDDSGSMKRSDSDTRMVWGPLSILAEYDSIVYDPKSIYRPPLDHNGSAMAHANFSSVYVYPYLRSGCMLCDNDDMAWLPSGVTCDTLCDEDSAELTRDLGRQFAHRGKAMAQALTTDDPTLEERALFRESPQDTGDPVTLADAYPFPAAAHQDGFQYLATPIAQSAVERNAQESLQEFNLRVAHYCLYPEKYNAGITCPAVYYKVKEGDVVTMPDGSQETCSHAVAMDALDTLTQAQARTFGDACIEVIEVGSDRDIAVTPDETLSQRRDALGELHTETDKELSKRNFANWFAYYSTRRRVMLAAAANTIPLLPPSVRIALQPLRYRLDEHWLPVLHDGHRSNTTSHRRREVARLFRMPPTQETYLRESAIRAYQYFASDAAYERSLEEAPGEDNPIIGCRRNFHLIFTDGAWSGAEMQHVNDNLAANVPSSMQWGNNDGTETPIPEVPGSVAEALGIETYALEDATRIYWDNDAFGLADIVFSSWIQDLRPDDDSNVPPLIRDAFVPTGVSDRYLFWNPANDPAQWQHITTFLVTLGVTPDGLDPDAWTYTDEQGGVTDLKVESAPSFGDFGAESSFQARKWDSLGAGVNGRGGYYNADNASELQELFRRVFSEISAAARTGSSARPAFNAGSTQSTRYAYHAMFDSSDWSGDLRAFRLSNGVATDPCPESMQPFGEFCDDPIDGYIWSAADRLDGNAAKGVAPTLWTNRSLFTGTRLSGGDHAGVAFDAATLEDQDAVGKKDRKALDTAALILSADPAIVDTTGLSTSARKARQREVRQALIAYISGNRDVEASRTEIDSPIRFRDRASLLGDIITAGPVVITPPRRMYAEEGYADFRSAQAQRPEIVLAGANDGLLHAFDGATGVEKWAYVPRPLFGKLWMLAHPGYGSAIPHANFVDGPITEGDVRFANGQWNTIVVGSLGLGAQGIYAVRVPSDPDNVPASDVHLWDFTDQDDSDMGYELGRPVIARALVSGTPRWVVLMANGYNASEADGTRATGCDDETKDRGARTCGPAVLYVLDAQTGDLITKFDTNVSRKDDPRYPDDPELREPNGLSGVSVIGRVLLDDEGNPVAGGELIATTAYAGDLYGNLWRFDLSGLSVSTKKGAAPALIFQARTEDDTPQAITTRIAIAPHPTGIGTMLLFGTGRYLHLRDVQDTTANALYGIWDNGSDPESEAALVERDALLVQEILHTDVAVRQGGGQDGVVSAYGRITTRNTPDWSQHKGWALDLEPGERVSVPAQTRNGRAVFVSVIPEEDPCEGGGYGWVTALSASAGAALSETPFDYDNDRAFGASDLLRAGDDPATPGSSIRLVDGGIFTEPALVPISNDTAKVVIGSSSGDLIEMRESLGLDTRSWGVVH